jgi:TRAP-type C4-dicarboxylate transport system permease small subunit
VLLLIGAYLLVRQAVPAIDADRAWPYGVVAIGLVLLVAAVVAPER